MFMIFKAARALAKRLIQRRDQRGARHQPRQAFAQHSITGELRKLFMELAGQPYPRREIAALIGLAFTSGRRADRLEPARAMPGTDPLDDRYFDDSPHLEDLVHFLHRRACDERATIRFEVDQPLARELRQRQAHGATLDIEYFA